MTHSQQLFSTITSDGELILEQKQVELPQPTDNEVLVKVEAAPINPSDMWPMFGLADLSKAKLTYNDTEKKLTAPIFEGMLPSLKTRLDQECPIGNEAAGTVISAGSYEAAQALVGKKVAILSGSTFAEYAIVSSQMCLPHAESTTFQEACSSFVNPLTALCMTETMRNEQHKALVHTAAASNLGQMLNRVCIADNIPLVNIVRKQEQVEILNALGAKHVINSTVKPYTQLLRSAIDQTGATLGFDATGGGNLANDILSAMEAVLTKDVKGLNTYGSLQHKQVYLYGGLDISPTSLQRNYGMSWGVGGWLLMRTLNSLEPSRAAALYHRVASEIKTTFASKYTAVLSFEEALSPRNIARYNAKKTGEKYLINPCL